MRSSRRHPSPRQRARQRLLAETSLIDPGFGALRIALAYPNTYYVGMSNLGIHTIYRLLNSYPEARCERVFLPDADEARSYRSGRTRLFTMESQTSIADFDVLAFSVSFENDYVNVLDMLDLAGLPLRARDRDRRHPLVLMGGAAVSINPEPIAPFVDAICLGEGEELVPALIDTLLECEQDEVLEVLATLPGFYVPSYYRPRYYHRDARVVADRPGARSNGSKSGDLPRFRDIEALPPAPPTVSKVRARLAGVERVASTSILTRDTEFSDRMLIEVARGCTKGCRYCWVGYNILPFRVHDVDDILTVAEPWRAHTDRIGLVATALLDHPQIESIALGLRQRGFRLFSPSLILSTLRETLLRAVIESGQRSITVAPETGSDRLRELIMKRITNEEILDKVEMIFEAGAVNLKNYVIIGLPGETRADLQDLIDLAAEMRSIMVRLGRPKGRIGTITLSTNCLIPKPGTPLQWAQQLEPRDYRTKLRWLRRRVAKLPNVTLEAMPPRSAEIQGVLSRGDRRTADLLEEWHRCRQWSQALQNWHQRGGPRRSAILQHHALTDALPWGHLNIGSSTAALSNQWTKAEEIAQRPLATSAAAD